MYQIIFTIMKYFYIILVLIVLLGCKKEILSSDKTIISFTIQHTINPSLTADVQGIIKNDTIFFVLPSDTMSKKLSPTIMVSPQAQLIPGSNVQNDFSIPQPYLVAAPDGSVKKYVVICQSKDSQKDVVSFTFEKASNPQIPNDLTEAIVNDTIKIRLPEGTSAELLPVIKVTAGAKVTSQIGRVDFSAPVHYTIEAEDGSSKTFVTSIQFIAPPKLRGFTINKATPAYVTSTNTYYFPVSPGTTLNNYSVSYDTTSARFLKLNLIPVSNKTLADVPLTTNQAIKVEVSDEFNRSYNYSLIITGMPVIQLSTASEIGDNYADARFTLIDPDFIAHKGEYFVTSNIGIKIRGATSRTYPKKQYAMQTRDDGNKETDKTLLGLRNDQNWILDAMYGDPGRMRNRLCTDIWNSFNNVPYSAAEPDAVNGTRGYMAEAFLNNEYLGVFCLTEKLDRKQLKVKKATGMLYKADNWGVNTHFTATLPYSNASSTWGGYEFAYPEIGDSPAPSWKPLNDFVNFSATSSTSDFSDKIDSKLYLDNAIDYIILINATAAADNTAKNLFFSFYDSSKDSKFFFSVWDLDATFGRIWSGEYFQVNTFEFLINDNDLFRKLFSADPENFTQRFKARWNLLKTNQLSKATVNAKIEAYKTQLISTKAGERENARWNVANNYETEARFMESWYSYHYDKLDQFINNL